VVAEDELFDAEQNARVVRAAEEYYRTMFSGGSPPGISATGT
jgi:erythromycin esterase-like protein